MARKCALTGKKTTSGQNRPFSLKATKRTFRPNLFWKRVFNPTTGRVEKMRLSAKAIRTLKKWAREIDAEFDAIETAEITEKTTTKDRVKKEKLTPKQKKEEAAKKEAETHEVEKTEKAVEIKVEKVKKSDKKDTDKKTK